MKVYNKIFCCGVVVAVVVVVVVVVVIVVSARCKWLPLVCNKLLKSKLFGARWGIRSRVCLRPCSGQGHGNFARTKSAYTTNPHCPGRQHLPRDEKSIPAPVGQPFGMLRHFQGSAIQFLSDRAHTQPGLRPLQSDGPSFTASQDH